MVSDEEKTLNLFKALAPEAVDWAPEETTRYIVRATIEGVAPQEIISEIQGEDSQNANFILLEHMGTLIVVSTIIKATWDGVRFADELAEFLLDHNKKLEIVETVIVRLKQAGLTRTAEQVEECVNKVLEQMTRP